GGGALRATPASRLESKIRALKIRKKGYRSFYRKETLGNRRFSEGRTKERPVHGLDTADPCEQRPQCRITELRHRLRVGDRRAALPRYPIAQDGTLARHLLWRVHCRRRLP